jgi:hypothetical protein
VGIQTPWAPPSDALATFTAQIIGADDAEVVTRESALRVPGVKRAHGIHASIVAGASWFEFEGDTKAADQPGWLLSSRSGVSPYHRMFGVASDLFMSGWACLAFTGNPWEEGVDALHIPAGLWGIDPNNGRVVLDSTIPAEYHALPVAIPLGFGENGLLIDAADTVRAARSIERAWMERVENPIPATDLHINDPAYNGMTKREKTKLVDQWNENRKRSGGQTAVTQSFLDVRALGQVSADLFEKGRNAVRLDLANHSAVPASIIEGAKDGGGSDLNYTNDGSKRAELYDFGTVRFVQAIEARLSLDDVCKPGRSIRADVSWRTAPQTPDTNPTSED